MNLHKFTRLAILLLLIVGLIPSLSAQVGVEGTIQQDLYLRIGPGSGWRIIDTMKTGTGVTLDGRDASAEWVRGVTHYGKIGWMSGEYTSVSPEQIAQLPVIDREAPLGVNAPQVPQAPQNTAPEQTQNQAPVPSGASPTSGIIGSPTNSNVNMRSAPGIGFGRVGMTLRGQALNIDGKDASGTWLRGKNGGGVVGWVYAPLITLNGDINALPVVDNSIAFILDAPAGPPPAANNNQASAPGSVNVQPIASTAPVRGFSYGGHVSGFGGDAVNWMHSSGMTWVKKQVRYTQGQDPGSIAGIIADAHAKGFRILLGVVGHTWELNNPGYYEQFAAFNGGLAALGADALEVWNEPNIDREWPNGQINPASYTQLLAQTYNAIKANNSNTMVISGAPAPTGYFGGCFGHGCDDAPFISGMAAAGAANYMDCLGIHYNEGIVPPSQTSGDPRSEHYTRYYWGMVNTYYKAFGGRRPLCFTELGFLSPEGFGPLSPGFAWAGNTTVAQQAAWIDQAVNYSRNSGKVRLLIIWNIDFDYYGDDPMAGYALIRPGGSCPACVALSQ